MGFPSVQTIARLRRRVRRKGKQTIELINLISSLTLEELDAASFLRLKRGYWVIESGLHHALDVTLGGDHSRIRHPAGGFGPEPVPPDDGELRANASVSLRIDETARRLRMVCTQNGRV